MRLSDSSIFESCPFVVRSFIMRGERRTVLIDGAPAAVSSGSGIDREVSRESS
jgi:hypothetical protein